MCVFENSNNTITATSCISKKRSPNIWDKPLSISVSSDVRSSPPTSDKYFSHIFSLTIILQISKY